MLFNVTDAKRKKKLEKNSNKNDKITLKNERNFLSASSVSEDREAAKWSRKPSRLPSRFSRADLACSAGLVHSGS